MHKSTLKKVSVFNKVIKVLLLTLFQKLLQNFIF